MLSDATKVNGSSWRELKEFAMDPNFWKREENASITEQEIKLLSKLIAA